MLKLDKINPQVASRNISAFSRWKRFDEGRQTLAKAQLERILSSNELRAENVFYKAVDRRWRCTRCTEQARDALGRTSPCKFTSALRIG